LNNALDAWREGSFGIETRVTSETTLGILELLQDGRTAYLAERFALQESWTKEKNRRRCELVDKEIDGTLSQQDRNELDTLQAEMLAYRRKLAPLPLDELRELHQELLRDVSGQEEK